MELLFYWLGFWLFMSVPALAVAVVVAVIIVAVQKRKRLIGGDE